VFNLPTKFEVSSFNRSRNMVPSGHLCANFEVPSFNRFQDMERVPKFQKVGHVTPSRPLLT